MTESSKNLACYSYGFSKLVADTFICWDNKAEDIERKFLSLNNEGTAPYNTFGPLKIVLGEDILFIRGLRILKSPSKKPAGTIISFLQNEIHVCTRTQNIAISHFYSFNQIPLSTKHLTNVYDLTKGHCLQNPGTDFLEKFSKNYSDCVRHESFWLKVLSNRLPGASPLSVSAKDIKKNHAKMIESARISPDVLSKIQLIALKEKTAASTVLFAIVLVYFYRINNYHNYSLGLFHPKLAKFSGKMSHFFFSHIPFTTDFISEMSFTEALSKTLSHLKELKAKQTYARDIYLRHPELARAEDINLVSVAIVPNIHKFKLSKVDAFTVVINQAADEFALYIRENVFSDSVHSLLGSSSEHINTIVSAIAENPSLLLNQVSFLTALENEEIFNHWNHTENHFADANFPVHHLFEKQVSKTPHLIAVSFENKSLTYFELNQKANQIAQYLKDNQISRGSIVALLAKRSLEMVIGILGILKSGAAYLPLDPNYPEERLSYMLANSGATTLLTDTSHLEYKVNSSALNKVDVKEIKEILNTSNARTQIYDINNFSPEDLAYIIYTSGTTGKPKGVAVSHGSLVNHMLWMIPKFNFIENDIFLQKTPFSFDASVWEFFAPLLCGGKLILAPNEMPLDYSKLIKKYGITVLQLVPSLLKALLEENEFQFCHSLKQVFSGGEALSSETVQLFHNRMKAQLHNLYGPTEATIQMTSYSYTNISEKPTKAILIGKPISNAKCYVLDKHLNPMPVGMVGELFIGGSCLAKGYVNQPNITKERFIKNPFDKQVKSLLYKTGDMVRWLSDGNLEYCGRLDEQVKINGFRIEIGEIESCLLEHESISECVVVVQEHEQKNDQSLKTKSLLAYYVRKSDESDRDIKNDIRNWEGISNLFKEFLSSKLPSYMIPSRFIPLEKLPLTVNGKLDKKALVVPEFNRSEDYIAPRNEVERQVCKIWTEVLGLPEDKIGMQDDFFNLGGHSLSALRTLSLIKSSFFIVLPTRTLFDYPTIEELATLIQNTQSSNAEVDEKVRVSPVICLRKNDFSVPLFLMHPVGGTIFWYKALSRYLDEFRAIYAIQEPGIDAKDLLFKNVSEMASFYIKSIQEIQPSGPYYLAGASFGATVTIEMAHQLLSAGEKVNFIGLLDGSPVYSKKFWEKDFFERLMLQQYQRMETQFINQGMSDIKFLLKLQQHRMSMLRYYKIPVINAKLTYFKAEELWTVFREMDLPLDCWQPYSTEPVDTYVVPGNHETMFWEPHVQVLAKKMIESLDRSTQKTLQNKYKNTVLRIV